MAGPIRYLLSRLLSSSSFKTRLWSRWYRYVEHTVGDRPIWFLNYGYAPKNGVLIELSPEDEANRTSIQLYDLVARPALLEGNTVLEVSSGRGGGARYLYQYRKPQLMVGLDRTEAAVAFSRRNHEKGGLRFVCGDAQQLPFGDAEFHAVINVEASHCYPNLESFLQEVVRVLRPGGSFCYADMRKSGVLDAWRNQLVSSGLHLVEEEDITSDVVRALEQSNDRVSALIHQSAPRWGRRFFSHFAATKGTAVYNQLRNGSIHYVRFHLKKSA